MSRAQKARDEATLLTKLNKTGRRGLVIGAIGSQSLWVRILAAAKWFFMLAFSSSSSLFLSLPTVHSLSHLACCPTLQCVRLVLQRQKEKIHVKILVAPSVRQTQI